MDSLHVIITILKRQCHAAGSELFIVDNSENDWKAVRYNSAPAIISARKYTLLIIGLAALALQIGWMESERLDRFKLFAYFDKTLTVHELLQKSVSSSENAATVVGTSLGPDSPPILTMGAGKGNPLELFRRVMANDKFSEVSFPGKTDELMTITDPGGSCTVRIFRGNGKGRFLSNEYSSLNRHQRFSTILRVAASRAYSVLFGRNCVFQLKSNEPVLLYQHEDKLNWGVVIPQELVKLGDFPGAHDSKQSREDFLFYHGDEFTNIELARFDGIDAPIVASYRVETVSAFVIESATRVSGKTYRSGKWRAALGDLVKSQAATPTILGIALPPQLAVVFMPLAILLLSMSVLHRTRRIRAADAEEPWILLQPIGWVELTAFWIWVLVLVIAPSILLWAGQIYDPNGFLAVVHNVQALVGPLQITDPYTTRILGWTDNVWMLVRTPAFYSILTALGAQLLLVGSVHRIFTLNEFYQQRWVSSAVAYIIPPVTALRRGLSRWWRARMRKNDDTTK